MAETDDWSAPEEAKDKGKGKPVAKTTAKAVPDRLIENRRRGIIVAHTTTAAGKDASGHDKYTSTKLVLQPGLNLVPATEWAKVEGPMQARIDASQIVVHDDFSKVKPPAAIEAINNTGDVKLLRKLLELEEREAIAKVIEKQIVFAERGGGKLRAAQDAHARR